MRHLSNDSDMRRIPEDTRQEVASRIRDGLSSRAIGAQLGVSPASVKRIRLELAPDVPSPSSGRPRSLSARDRRAVVRAVTSGRADTAPQVVRELSCGGVTVSVQSVRRALKDAGLKAYVKKRKPLLSARHRKARLEFAQRHRSWTFEDWSRVIFSDETKFNRLGSDGRKWIWRQPSQGLRPRDVQGTLKFGGGSLMFWGCMSASGVGHGCKIDGTMDAVLYRQILEGEFMQSVEHFGMNEGHFIFQHDNDPKHKSRIASEWLREKEIEVLEWPSQSPDLNPIEHVWDYMKRRLSDYETAPVGMIELWNRIEAEWERIPEGFCSGLIESIPRRMAAVLKAKGGYTSY